MASILTDEVVRYQETGKGWRELSDRISLYAYKYPMKTSDWDEDRCSDFFLAFHPRIPRLVERFRPKFNFETYLSCCLKWYMKTFSDKVADREHYECWWSDPERARYDECGALVDSCAESFGETSEELPEKPEPGACGGIFTLDSQGHIADPAIRKRLLFITLLRAGDLDSRQVEAMASLVNVDPEWLFNRVRMARDSVLWKLENRERLRRRRNECWYRLESAGRRRKAEEVRDGNRYREWQRKEKTWRSRYRSASEGLKKSRVNPSHKEIGRLLNVPAGTVSSGLHLIRKAWDAVSEASG